MLLIDGIKYELWTPPTEDEFERVVKEHSQDIFGEQSIYIDIKTKLKSELGTGSVPDGLLIFFGDRPHWRIVEIELSGHPLHDHIVSQVGRFISGIENPITQKKITDIAYSEIVRNDLDALKLRKAIQPNETYKFLSDLISRLPILTIIIEKETPGLKEALRILNYPQIEVVEFRTFMREGVGLDVHAHLFEPIYQVVAPKVTIVSERGVAPALLSQDTLEITITNPSFTKFHVIYIPKDKRRFFPGFKTPFELETDIGTIQTYVSSAPAGTQVGDPTKGVYFQANLAGWYRQHPELKVGDRLVVKVLEPMKKYRLEILN